MASSTTSRMDDPWADLVTAILSVNQYPVSKTALLAEALRREGLFRPQNLARSTSKEIGTRLRNSGYDRGGFLTWLFADRLESLGKFVESVGIEKCEIVLRTGRKDEIRALLLPVHGIGPKVLDNFFTLREI